MTARSRFGKLQVLRPRLPAAEQLLPWLRQIDHNRVYSNYGPLSMELGRRLANRFGLDEERVVCAGSGTAALVGAILASAGRAEPGRDVALVPAFTFVATAMAAELCGYRVLFCDVDEDSWQLQPRHVEAAGEDGVGVVLPVASFGRAVAQAPWRAYTQGSGIPVVIDGAASFEQILATPADFLGDVPVALSFHATKSFATGEGGCVLTDSQGQADEVTRALNFGFLDSRECAAYSINGKMSEYHAAVGLAELEGWADKSADLARVARAYEKAFTGHGLGPMLHCSPHVCSSYALAQAPSQAVARAWEAALPEAGVGFRHWYGESLNRQAYYADRPAAAVPVSERLASRILGLPVAPDLEADAIDHVARTLATALDGTG